MVLGISFSPAAAQLDEKTMIAAGRVASSVCAGRDPSGYSDKSSSSQVGNVGISAIVRGIIHFGGNAEVKHSRDTETNRGVLAKDVADAIRSYNDCVPKMMTIIVANMRPATVERQPLPPAKRRNIPHPTPNRFARAAPARALPKPEEPAGVPSPAPAADKATPDAPSQKYVIVIKNTCSSVISLAIHYLRDGKWVTSGSYQIAPDDRSALKGDDGAAIATDNAIVYLYAVTEDKSGFWGAQDGDTTGYQGQFEGNAVNFARIRLSPSEDKFNLELSCKGDGKNTIGAS